MVVTGASMLLADELPTTFVVARLAVTMSPVLHTAIAREILNGFRHAAR
jgi:hypothetical protein